MENIDPIDEIAVDGMKLLATTKTGKFYQLTTYRVMNQNDRTKLGKLIVQHKFYKRVKDQKFNNSWIQQVMRPHLITCYHTNGTAYRATLLETIDGNGTRLLISSGDRTMIGRHVSVRDQS